MLSLIMLAFLTIGFLAVARQACHALDSTHLWSYPDPIEANPSWMLWQSLMALGIDTEQAMDITWGDA